MPSVPFKVKAVFEYRSEEPDDLNFDNGQIITVTEEEDADWYTGEYLNASGEKLEGLFPRNFVEKYEPAVPSRPVRAPKRAAVPDATEHPPEPPVPQPVLPPVEPAQPLQDEEKEPPRRSLEQFRGEPEAPPVSKPAVAPPPSSTPSSPPQSSKAPPPVAEKPTSNSFKDRIAAFNKPAAAPVAPFKPGGGPPSGFIKKPFVAPPPSRNAYVPPARDPAPVQKPYRREEDPSLHEPEPREPSETAAPHPEAEPDDQPKPQSLKERIALLQKQQLEQAARNAEKKDKPKKPPKKRVEPTESGEQAPPPEPGLTRADTSETVNRTSGELADREQDIIPGLLPRRTTAPPQPQPSRELVSDTNDADDSGAGDDEDAQDVSTEEERPKSKGADQVSEPARKRSVIETQGAVEQGEDEEEAEEEEEEDEEEEEEEDPEARRRRELRDRMAKMSGGMGMMGMFGPPGGMGAPGGFKKPRPADVVRQPSSESYQQPEGQERAAPVALPGMSNPIPKRQEELPESDEDETARPTPQDSALHESEDYISRPPQRRSTDRPPPPPPQERAVPPPPPREARAAPPPPPGAPPVPQIPQTPTSRPMPPPPPAQPESDQDEDEDETPREMPVTPLAVPPPPPPTRLDTSESTVAPTVDKRASRLPPPIPMSPTSPQTRAPPPPPPGFPPSRRSTSDSRGFGAVSTASPDADDEDEVTEYDGDYDTDIASSAKHKDALKSHNRDSSLDEEILTDDAVKSPKGPPVRSAPPMPPVPAPRDMAPAPPAPAQAPPKTRKSMDAPRAAPPPVPPPQALNNDEDYDPYRYSAPQHPPPPPHPGKAPYSSNLQTPSEEIEEDDMYSATPQQTIIPPPPAERAAPPPPPDTSEYISPPSFAPHPPSESPRQSLDLKSDMKRAGTVSRRSMDHSWSSNEQGFMAHDLDLGRGSMWWTQNNAPPPSLQGRPDILYEMETTSSTKRGGKSTISKDVYVLYMDYSQTTINASFDSSDPSHVTLEQNHERPPPPPRRDQLENSSTQYGTPMARVANGLLGSTVGDGSARAFVLELLKPHSTALLPIGTRAYGALVYANLGNASTQQFDEIRPGDIVTFRNAKFSGHKGGLHAKYSVDVGKPEHVAVVIDWDGTKKKIRAWEQGRDLEKGKRAKVREESFKVGDLKSGEVMVWRVMPRTWVGWDTIKS